MTFKIPHKITIDPQFHDLFKKACSQLKIDRPYILQPTLFKNYTTQEIYINDIKTFFRKTPSRMAEYNQLLTICRDILIDCKLIEKKGFLFQQINQFMPVVKPMIQEGRRLEIFKSQLRKIQELDKQKIPLYEKNLKSQKVLTQNDKPLLLEIVKMKKEPNDLNKLRKVEMDNASLLENNRLIVNMLASIKARGISQKDIQNTTLISDKGLSSQLALFLQFLRSYFVDLSKAESPFLKVLNHLSQDKPINDIKMFLDQLPKTQRSIINPLVQKLKRNQHTQRQTGPLFELDRINYSSKELHARIEELSLNLQIAESQKTELSNKQEQQRLNLQSSEREYEKKMRSAEAKSRSIEQNYIQKIEKMNQQLEDYRDKLRNLQEENTKYTNVQKKNEKPLIRKQSERDTARLAEENKNLKQRIREAEDRLTKERGQKQQQMDRILKEENEMARNVSSQPPKNSLIDPLLSQYKDQCELFTLELERQRENHAKLQHFLTQLQRQLRKNENQTISKLRANQKMARKNYSELEALHKAQIEEIKKLYTEISLEKEANQKTQGLKAQLNTLREQYNQMKENYAKMFAGDGQNYSVNQPQLLAREKSRK